MRSARHANTDRVGIVINSASEPAPIFFITRLRCTLIRFFDDTQVGGGLLVELAGKNVTEHFAFARGQSQ
jgi:hypothetical protein